jgi:glycosyltransferase involved in cell wall biosynthesis
LRIGLVIYGSLDILTGGFLYDRKVVEHLRSQGHKVQVFALPWRNYPLHLDILVQDELNHPSLFWLNRRAKKRIKCPAVSIVHHLRCNELRPQWQNRIYRVVERQYLCGMDGFVFNSQTTRRSVEKLLPAPKPSVIGYPGRLENTEKITEDEILKRAVEDGPLRIVFVGSLIPRKELHTLIKALRSLPLDSWLLEVVGDQETDPGYSASVLRLIEQSGISDRVRMHGRLSAVELNAQYRDAHLLAVPSSYEGFGIVYLEAMAYGLPSIASTTGAAHETVTHGLNGFLVAPGDASAIAGHISDLNRDRNKLAQMGIAGLKRHLSHPTWKQTGRDIEAFLEKMIACS